MGCDICMHAKMAATLVRALVFFYRFYYFESPGEVDADENGDYVVT